MNTLLHPSLQAVIFDMDGLMLDTERMAQRAWQKASAEAGYDLPAETYLEAVGRTRDDTKGIFLQRFGPKFPFDALYTQKQRLLFEMLESEPIPTKPGIFELLELLDRISLRRCVATSTARELAIKKLTYTKLFDHFEGLVGGDEVTNGKPAPDIFLAGAQLLDVHPSTCVVLEDSEAGVRAAHAAGMMPIMVPDLKQPSPEIAALTHAVVVNLDDAKEVIESLVSGSWTGGNQ